jgi:hypothetical protein
MERNKLESEKPMEEERESVFIILLHQSPLSLEYKRYLNRLTTKPSLSFSLAALVSSLRRILSWALLC